MNGTQPLAIKVHSLTGRITIELMRRAFLNVKKNRGAAGVDRQSIKMFERQLEQNLVALMRVLKDRSFEPLPSRREHIDKGGGKTRDQAALGARASRVFEIGSHKKCFDSC